MLTHCDNGGKIKIKTTHRFAWGNNPKRATLKGRECKILASGKMNSIVVEFEDGQKECVSHQQEDMCPISGPDEQRNVR